MHRPGAAVGDDQRALVKEPCVRDEAAVGDKRLAHGHVDLGQDATVGQTGDVEDDHDRVVAGQLFERARAGLEECCGLLAFKHCSQHRSQAKVDHALGHGFLVRILEQVIDLFGCCERGSLGRGLEVL